jgi:hypothetical protein
MRTEDEHKERTKRKRKTIVNAKRMANVIQEFE